MSLLSSRASLQGPLFLEKKVAEKLGLSRAEMRFIRQQTLKKNKHWGIVGRDGVLTQPAIARLLEYLKATSNAKLPEDFSDCVLASGHKKNGAAGTVAPGPTNVVEELVVKRTYPNPRLLLATNAAGEEVRVRVNSNQHFVPKMKLAARPIGGGLYQMQGRCPRYKGRY